MTDQVFKTEKIKENSYAHYHVGRKPNTLHALPYVIVGNSDQMSMNGEWLTLEEAKRLKDVIDGFLKASKKVEPKEEKEEPSPSAEVKEEEKPKKKSKSKKSEATPAQVEDDAAQ